MSYTKYVRFALLAGLCLVPFLAFVVAAGGAFPNLFFPYITGKNFAFRILVEILLFLYVVLAIRDPQYRPKPSLLMWSALAFFIWIGVSTVFSVDPVKSFWSNFERMDGYITLIHLFVLFVISGAVLTAAKWWTRFFQVSVVSSAFMGLYALLQVAHLFGLAPSSQSGARADTTFGNATYLAVYMLFNIFITLFLLVPHFRNKAGNKYTPSIIVLYAIALVLQFVTLYYTETRGALLGVVGGLIVAAFYILWRAKGAEWQGLRRTAIASLGVIVLLAGGFFAVRNIPAVQNHGGTLSRLASISLSDPTTVSRLKYIWPTAIKGAMEKPITGWGEENFNYVFNKYYSPEMYNQEQWFDRAHNQFLDWLVEGGVPAFLLYVSLVLLFVWLVFRSDNLSAPEQAMLIGLMAAYCFNNLFVFDNIMSVIYFYLLLAFAHGVSAAKLPGFMFLSKPGNDRMVAVAAPIALVLVLWAGWTLNAPGLARAQTLIDALQTQKYVSNGQGGATQVAKDPTENLASFETALSQGELGKQETVEQFFQFASNAVAPSSSVSPDVKQQVFAAALSAGQEMLKERPNDARLELFMSVFLSQFGQTDQAITYLNQALKDSPDKQQILFQLGATYLQKGDSQDALTVLKKAYDLEPNYDTARILYAIGLYTAGQTAQGDALLTERFHTTLVDDDRLIQTYTDLKMFDRVIGIWKARVAANPKDLNNNIGLATAYFTAGDKQSTIAQLKAIEVIDPSLAPQMESVITQIQNGTLKP